LPLTTIEYEINPEIKYMRYPAKFILLILLFLLPSAASAGYIDTKIDLSCAVDKKNDIAVNAMIANKGNSTAYRVTLSLFMEEWAQKFDNLGDNQPDGMLKFNETISMPGLKPGTHILVARISFEEQNGTSHRIYQYCSFSCKTDKTDKEPDLSLELKPPLFNVRSFIETKKKMEFTINNRSKYSLSPVISFFLSDGYTAGDASIQTTVPPNNKVSGIVVIEKDKSINQGGNILAVAWYDKDGIISSVKAEGTAGVEEKPFLFKWYLIFSVIILIAVTIYKAIRRQS